MGLLMAQGGGWNGKQILPKGWTEELVKPCLVAPFYDLMWWDSVAWRGVRRRGQLAPVAVEPAGRFQDRRPTPLHGPLRRPGPTSCGGDSGMLGHSCQDVNREAIGGWHVDRKEVDAALP